MNLQSDRELIEYLEGFISEQRKEVIDRNLANRTKYITVALENVFQAQNASAVIRTADCCGIHDVHIIENSNEYIVNPDVVMGATKWVDINRYNKKENNTLDAIKSLKKEGYRIVATSPHTDDTLLSDFDLSKGKSAFFFGTELTGLSDIVMQEADEFVKIPMYGFTESFNISVSAALVLHQMAVDLRKSEVDWELPTAERNRINIDWLRKSIRSGDEIIEDFFDKKK